MREVDQDTFWSAVPELLFHHLGVNEDIKFNVWSQLVRNFIRGIRTSTGPTIYCVGPYLSISTSIQHDRVLEPVLKLLSERYGRIEKIHLPKLGLGRTMQQLLMAERLNLALRKGFREGGQKPLRSIRELLGQTAILHARFEAFFDSTPDPYFVLIATQHGASVRAALRAVQTNAAITTVYLPHAPFASNIFYADLPVHFAFLRGKAELDKYSEMTDLQDRLRVVGDPSKSDLTSPQLAGETFLYVVSDYRTQNIESEVELIRSSGVEPIEVCPHPRMERSAALLALFPKEWTINPYRTTHERIIAGGVKAVIQRNSGAGIDALQSGIPVINLAVPGISPNYPYLLMPEVIQVLAAEELAHVARSLERSSESDELRIKAAAQWVAAVDGPSLSNISLQLRSILNLPPSNSLIFDAWKLS